MVREQLRIGVMCLGPEVSLWEKQCIDHLLATGYAEICLMIIDAPENYPTRSFYRKLVGVGFSKFLFNVYLKTLYRPASLRKASIRELFDRTPSISCIVQKKGKYSQYFRKEDLEQIRSYDLDVILRFGFNIIRGEILEVSRYGVWSFHHDDEMRYRGGPPCFWEIYYKDAETGSVLQRLTDELDGGIVLKKGIFRTKSYSYAKSVDQAYFETAKWPAWVAADIVHQSAGYLHGFPTSTIAPIYRYPTNGQFLKFLIIMWGNFIRSAWSRLFMMQQWNVALIRMSIHDFLRQPADAPKTFLKLKNRSTFNADCFGRKQGNHTAVLFEELDYSKEAKGALVVALVDHEGTEIKRIKPSGIADTTHLSYPYLFEEDGDVYLVPESGAQKKVILYKAEQFPARWKEESVLLNGAYYFDASLLKYENKYWLFFTLHDQMFDANLHLHLAYSDTIGGPYTLHLQNPVKVSARSARPAGTMFKDQNGRLIRPAQNFCKTYGGSIVLNEVIKLNEKEYEEREAGELVPFDKYYKDGLHTLSVINDQEILVDMKRHRFRLAGIG